eukprot:scaffold209302_cov38-Prasinocladus_malaysianus.AAC.2
MMRCYGVATRTRTRILLLCGRPTLQQRYGYHPLLVERPRSMRHLNHKSSPRTGRRLLRLKL